MSTPQIAPGGSSAAAATPPSPPRRRGSSLVVSIVLIVIGAFVVLGAVFGSVAATFRAGPVLESTSTIDVRGADALQVQLDAGSLRIDYADVREAELSVRGVNGADDWTLEVVGDTLRVFSPHGEWSFPWSMTGSGDAVLTLPMRMSGADADLHLDAGALEATGDFGVLSLTVGAGEITVDGSAEELAVDLSAGGGTLALDDVSRADIQVSAGAIEAQLRGTQPDDIVVDVRAGSLTLTVPEGRYDVTSDVSAGELLNGLGTAPGSSHRVQVDVSAGQVVLRNPQ